MATMRARGITATSSGHFTEEMRSSIRRLAEEGDLLGLAAIAEMSLSELRRLCERPVTCSELGEMLDKLEQLNLDESELHEE